MTSWFSRFTRSTNIFVSSPGATFAAFTVVAIWAASGPFLHFSQEWQLIINTGTTIVTFLMVFVLNNAQSRDTSAINAKLDALIHAIETADNRFIGLERRSTDHVATVVADLPEPFEEPGASV
jgi:low affinity Fe/Cu permease